MACSARVVVQAQLVETEGGLVPEGDGWFVLNACEAQWWKRSGLGTVCDFEGELRFQQLGINLTLLEPGEPMTMYHWEANQEDFLMLSGEALLVIEGEERTIREWDFVHCPPGTNHGDHRRRHCSVSRACGRRTRRLAPLPLVTFGTLA